MLTAFADSQDFSQAPVRLHDACETTVADPRDLVEWEMSAVQVGSLVVAFAAVLGVVSLFA